MCTFSDLNVSCNFSSYLVTFINSNSIFPISDILMDRLYLQIALLMVSHDTSSNMGSIFIFVSWMLNLRNILAMSSFSCFLSNIRNTGIKLAEVVEKVARYCMHLIAFSSLEIQYS